MNRMKDNQSMMGDRAGKIMEVYDYEWTNEQI